MTLTEAPVRQKASTMQISTSSRSNSGVGSAMVPSLLPTLPGSRRRGGVRSSDKLAPGQAQTPASTAAQQRNIESKRAFYFLQHEEGSRDEPQACHHRQHADLRHFGICPQRVDQDARSSDA